MSFSSNSSAKKTFSSQPLRKKTKDSGTINTSRSQLYPKSHSNDKVQNDEKSLHESEQSDSNESALFADCVSNMNDIFNLPAQSGSLSNSQTRIIREESEISFRAENIPSGSVHEDISRQKTKSKRLSSLREKIRGLEQRKNLLSEFDTTGAIVRSLIDVTKELLDSIDEENLEYESHTNYFLVQPDPTYKNSKSNRIYVEGTLPLDLDSYEKAIRRARFKTPGSFAYQLIKFAFPETYFINVTLGKREISESEFKQKATQKKKPLVYVLGFADPLDKPFQGSSCMKRGEKRIRALIDHIFRKSGKLEYTSDDEMKVRSRIIKELSRKNHGVRDSVSPKQDSIESNDEDSYKSVFDDDSFDNQIFDENTTEY